MITLCTAVLCIIFSIHQSEFKESEFHLLGGWRVTGEFARGGTTLDHDAKKLYMVGHAQRNEVYEFDLPDYGKGADLNLWPILKPVRVIPGWWKDGYGNSLTYQDGKLWVAERKFYDTALPPTLTIYSVVFVYCLSEIQYPVHL